MIFIFQYHTTDNHSNIKGQPLEHIHQKRNQQVHNTYFPPENYPIIQHTDFTLNTNKTEPYTQLKKDPNYAELINTIKFSLPSMDDFKPKYPRIYNFFYKEKTEIIDVLLYEAQQQDPVIRQLILWKKYKNLPYTPSLTIRANKGLLHYYRRFSQLSIIETNNLLYYIRETQSPKIGLPLSLLLTTFHNAHSHNLSGHPGREKTHATIIKTNYFPIIKTWIAILTEDCLNCQTSKSMPNLLMAPQQPFLEVSPYFNHRISMDTKGPISLSSDENSYVYVIVDAFTHFVVLHPSTKNDAKNALTVLFDHWIKKKEYQIFW